MNFEKNISAAGLLMSSILLFMLGLAIFIKTDVFLDLFPYVAGIILIFTSLSKFYSFYTDKNKTSRYLLLGDFAILLQGIVAILEPEIVVIIFPVFVVIYSIILGIISVVVYYQYRKARTPYSVFMLLKGLAYFAAAALVITAEQTTVFSTRITGFYLIIYLLI